MATRSTIAIKLLDGSVKQIYCHYDGYFDHNGILLKSFYNTPDKVKALIEMGDISHLAEELEDCIFYHRDRDEDLQVATFESWDWFKVNRRKEEYNYVYDEADQYWYLIYNTHVLGKFLMSLDPIISS